MIYLSGCVMKNNEEYDYNKNRVLIGDWNNKSNGSSNQEFHADWVKRDAEKHKHISEQYDRDWA